MGKKIYTICITIAFVFLFAGIFLNVYADGLPDDQALSMLTISLILDVMAVIVLVGMYIYLKNHKFKDRSTFRFEIKNGLDNLEAKLQSFLANKKFYYNSKVLDEIVYEKGTGLLIAKQCLKFYIEGNTLIVEAWIVGDCLERNLEGKFYGAIPKKQLLSILNELQAII